MKTNAVILAAGQGTRMRSAIPKVLHPLLGKPMVWYSLDAAQKATGQKPLLVIGHGAQAVRQAVGEEADFVLQELLAPACPCCRPSHTFATRLILSGDYGRYALFTMETYNRLLVSHRNVIQIHGLITLLSINSQNSRIGREFEPDGEAVIEESQATQEVLARRSQHQRILFTASWLWNALPASTFPRVLPDGSGRHRRRRWPFSTGRLRG
jgi:bifunctional UDP-N-acetylglucosamine pyrophosphorylase/glucosamine-1-phosphate N-acetyltransferase